MAENRGFERILLNASRASGARPSGWLRWAREDERMPRGGSSGARGMMRVTMVVDVANVIGSRPDGWWKDRAGAATRLLALMPGLVGRDVAGPDGEQVIIERVLAIVEGAAKAAAAPEGVVVVRARKDGDSSIVSTAGNATSPANT